MTETLDKRRATPSEPGRVSYPPAPWDLTGHLYGSLWLVPRREITANVPNELQIITNPLGQSCAFAGFVEYREGSPLTYHELLAGILVRKKGSARFALHVSHIWVDSVASLYGGRELWGVPKDLAEFKFDYANGCHELRGVAWDADGSQLAEGYFSAGRGLLDRFKLVVPFPNLQILNGRLVGSSAPMRSNFHLTVGVGMTIPHNSVLASLGIAGKSPFLNFAGLNFNIHLEAAKSV
jgi:Acetoacetate decarboxylase (ADC)